MARTEGGLAIGLSARRFSRNGRNRAGRQSRLDPLPIRNSRHLVNVPTEETPELVNRVIRGDVEALADLFSFHRQRLWRMVHFRMDQRLAGRVDADDVLQEAWIRSVDRIDSFIVGASRSTFIWFRMIVTQTLVEVHRRHELLDHPDRRVETR